MSKADYEFIPANGGLKFAIEGHGENHWVVIPEELLEDEVGSGSDTGARMMWVEENIESIVDAYKKKRDGGFIRKPFDRIVVKGE